MASLVNPFSQNGLRVVARDRYSAPIKCAYGGQIEALPICMKMPIRISKLQRISGIEGNFEANMLNDVDVEITCKL